MPILIADRDDLIIKTKNKEAILAIRTSVLEKFPGVWVLIHKDNSELFGLEVSSVWGNRLPKDQEQTIAEFAKIQLNKVSKSSTIRRTSTEGELKH